MDTSPFQRLVAAISAATPRRVALRLLGGSGIAALAFPRGNEEIDARKKKKKKKRCRKRRESCGGKKKCCGTNVACGEFPTATCASLSGRVCCGLEGAECDNSIGINNCDCCDGLFCGGLEGIGRCQEEPT